MKESAEQWFAREILVHEAALTRYLLRVWRNRDEVHDLRQEVYVRVFEAALTSPPYAPKAFLFTTARNLMANRIRRNKVIFIGARGDLDAMNVLIDEVSPEQSIAGSQELGRLAQAFDRLPQRCRSVMWMRKVQQLSQKEVASRLGVREKAVEKQISRGMRLLAKALLGGGFDDAAVPGKDGQSQQESEHG